jgi:hypothetical protein
MDPNWSLALRPVKKLAKKRKNDADARLAGKCVKVSGRKAAVPKAPAAQKGTCAASSKAASLHIRSVMTAGGLPRVGASPKAAVPKSTAMQAMPKARVLKISTGVKRPSSAEPLQVSKGKHAKVNVAPSPTPTPIHRAVVRPQPLGESDDGYVVDCVMLGAPVYGVIFIFVVK